MSALDGNWACTVETPMGAQSFTLTVASAGTRFSGRAEGGLGSIAIDDGTIDGDTLRWPMRVPKPIPLTLACTATVTGDRLEGDVSAGVFGSFAIRGTRAR